MRSRMAHQFQSLIEPGPRVRPPREPGWGLVLWASGERVTVNFADRGKVVINARLVSLEVVE